MGKNQTEKSRWPSQYGTNDDGSPRYITAAQYCIEQLCALIAHQNKQTLPPEFWKADKKWARFFSQQSKPVNALINKYGAEAVVAALKDKRCKRMRSFRATFIIEPVIQRKKKEIDALNKQALAEAVETVSTTSEPRKPSKPRGQSLFGKLREIEHGQEETREQRETKETTN